ncbi:MAG: SipW-dependent-type signal peptide-containing protein [Clostridiales bacterium]|nr:SipW-dependent-type signal peptide-containing protein [Clostridiales bacterium]
MKKKIVSLALAVCLIAIAAVGTLAYFTDKDAETNTFTAGGVKIDLIEQQVNEAGTELEAFEQNQVLMPIVGSAQGEKDDFGQPVAANYIDKIVTIKNTGKSAAYVRAYFAIPAALDDGYETFNAGANILHFNFGNVKTDNGLVSTEGVQWNWTHGNKWNYFETTIDNVAYNVYFADYYQTLAAGATTEQFVSGVYLDSHVDMDAQGNYIDTRFPDADLSILNGSVKCPVFAVAVQADGFDSAADAVDAAFGAQYNPWGGTATNWQ